MGLRTVACLILLLGYRGCSSRHSLCYSYLKVSEPSQGLPQFLSVVYLDGHPIARYDILNGKTVPLVPRMEAEEMKAPEKIFRADLEQLSELNNQTGGFHTWQVVLGCELRENGSKRGFLHYGYDGKDFISFEKETPRWVAAQPQAEKVKEKWEDDLAWSQKIKDFLERTCIEWLQRHLSYQNETLKKTEPPVGKVTHKVVNESLEVLICQAFGFYPKEIQATWKRDGEACQNETLQRNLAPNSDGTYYIWLNIEVDPKERNRFRCHLKHKGLQEPLVLAFPLITDRMSIGFVEGLIIIIIPVVLIFFLYCCWLYRKNLRQAMTTCLDHLSSEIHCSSTTSGAENEMQSQAMLPPKVTLEGCSGQETELREDENKEASESSEWGLEEHLKDAETTKSETSEDPTEKEADEHLPGEEKGKTPLQLEGSQTQPEAQDGEELQLQLISKDENPSTL